MKFSAIMKYLLVFMILLSSVTSSALATTYVVPATQGAETLDFGLGADSFHVQITDGRVVGGYSQGTLRWTAVGGFYDGFNLHVTFVTSQQTNCNQWFTHTFEVGATTVTLKTTVDKCNQATTNRNAVYQRQ